MSMSIASLEDLRTRLTAIGKDHVYICANASTEKLTGCWFGRLANRVFSDTFNCGRADNKAVCDKLVALIKDTPKLGESYAKLARDMLDKMDRSSGANPLSGRKAAKVLERVMFLARDDGFEPTLVPTTKLYRGGVELNISEIEKEFGRESIPYARFLIGNLAGTKGALSKKEYHDQLLLMMRFKHKEVVAVALDGIKERMSECYSENQSAAVIIEDLQSSLTSLRSTHLWQIGQHPMVTWVTPPSSKIMKNYLDTSQKELDIETDPEMYKGVIKEMSSSYGRYAISYAQEYVSFPWTRNDMLRENMRATYKRLKEDAIAIVDREFGAEVPGKSTTLDNFLNQITKDRGPSPRPIDQWMWSILVKVAYDKMHMAVPPAKEGLTQPADV